MSRESLKMTWGSVTLGFSIASALGLFMKISNSTPQLLSNIDPPSSVYQDLSIYRILERLAPPA